MTRICGRTTRKRLACKLPVSRIYRWPHGDDFAPACAAHLTPDETAAFDALRTADADALAAAHRQPPACHSWSLIAPVEPDQVELDIGVRYGGRMAEALRLCRQLLTWQADRCAICGELGGDVEDHCHRSGLFRGWLCHSCNIREGLWDTTTFRLYRERPPAVILGYTYQYDGYGCSDGAEPEQWVVDALGPRPPDHSPEAAAYLAAAATLDKPRQRPDNPLKKMGL